MEGYGDVREKRQSVTFGKGAITPSPQASLLRIVLQKHVLLVKWGCNIAIEPTDPSGFLSDGAALKESVYIILRSIGAAKFFLSRVFV